MKIPRDCDGTDLAKALRHLGYKIVRQDGSHIRLTTEEKGQHHLTIPTHRPLKVGLLHGLLKEIADHSGLTIEEVLSKLDM